MKKFYITLLASLLLLTNYATDLYVNNSGQAGTYTTITAAISAAATSGDRIFVSPYGVYTENLTVNKSITLVSAVSGTNFNVLGNFWVTADAGMDVRIIGGIFSSTLNANTNTATQNSMTDIYVIDSEFSSINLNDNFVRAHILFCSNMGSIDIQNGEIIGCSINQSINSTVVVRDGPNTVTGDTVKIIGNIISGDLDYASNDNYYVIANNSIGVNNDDLQSVSGSATIQISSNSYNSSVNNLFLNNFVIDATTSSSYATIFFNNVGGSINFSNVLIKNNLIINRNAAISASNTYSAIRHNGATSLNPSASYNFCLGNLAYVSSTQNTLVDAGDGITDFWDNVNSYIDSLGRCSNSDYCINKGIPSIDHYDIDMTINDIGTYGGPYSIDNYINNTNGKARIYDLDIPFEIWSGQTPTVKAKGAHTK